MKQLHLYKVMLLLFAVVVSGRVSAQYPNAASYPFEASSKTFTYLSGGTSVNLQSDDRTVTGIPIGFTFEYCNATYTTMSACSNGFMAFGNDSYTGWSNSQGNMGNFNPGLMPLWDDLQGRSSTTTYKTTGTAGSRVFTFEWRNTRPLANTSNPVISMQVKLYEGANAIEFIYKREHATTNFPSATIGLAGRASGDYKVLNNASANPTASSTTFTTNITTKPLTDQSYLWGDLPKGYNNASVSKLESPNSSFCANSTVPVSVLIKNKGKNIINSVTVEWTVDGNAQTPVNVNTTLYPAGGGTPNSTVVNLGNVNFGAAAKDFVVYTTMPNGIADTVNVDDTLQVRLRASLSGVYTVGTGGDFNTIKEAADELNKYGVCGPVVMNIMPGVYSDQVELNTIQGASATNRVTFKSQNGNPSTVFASFAPTGSSHVFKLKNSSYVTIKDITIQSTGSNAGRVLVFEGNSSFDSVLNCQIEASATYTSSNTAGIYGTELGGSNNVFIGNTVNRGYYGIYWRGISSGNLTDDNVFEDNTVNENRVYAMYFYENNNLKVRNNIATTLNSTTTFYGVYAYYNDNNFEFTGNKITVKGSGGTTYGMRFYYNDGTSSNMGIIGNNTVAIDKASGPTVYGIYAYYSRYQNFINNSVSINTSSTSSQAARFYYSNSSSYRNNTIRNNVFYNAGSGLGMYVYYVGRDCSWDYNNIYTTGTNLIQRGSPSGTYKTLEAWRNASDQDVHSITYNPGFTSLTDLHPDPNNPDAWSLNGRAVHIAGNDKDIDGNNRIDQRADGVPDLGAYEFEPSSLPPLATPDIPNPVPGDKQIFTFGENVVATVDWNTIMKVTSPIEVRQYSGRKAPGFTQSEFMYFYTDIKNLAPSNTYNFDFKLNYMDIWLGTMSNEPDIKLAHKFKNSAWVGYNGAASVSSPTNNTISSATKTSFGMFTGTMDGDILSAFITPGSSTIICYGHDVLLTANSGMGYTYKWRLNGVEISGATGQTYLASQPGDYTVEITDGNNKTAESIPVTVVAIAPPNAIVNASGNLTYCTGGTLSLNTLQGAGLTYQWKLNGSNIPGANSANHNVNQAGQYTVVVSNAGCGTESLPQNVQAGPLEVDLGIDINACESKDKPITLDAGFPGAKYYWSTGETTQTIEAKQSGTYTVRVDAGPNCVDIDDIEVTLTPLPSSYGISYVKNGNTYSFTPSNPQNTTGYLWIFGDGTTSSKQSVTKTIVGDPYVRMVLFNQCGSDTTQLGWALSVNNVNVDNDITLYPNPANDVVTVNVPNDVDAEAITIVNSLGVVVSKPAITKGQQSYTINVSALPAGYYMLQLRMADRAVCKPFNIVR